MPHLYLVVSTVKIVPHFHPILQTTLTKKYDKIERIGCYIPFMFARIEII